MRLSCPLCQARLDISPEPSDGRVTCPSCRAIFTAAKQSDETPRMAPPDETGATGEMGVWVRPAVSPRPRAADRAGGRIGNGPPKATAVPWYLLGIALLPLVLPAVAIPLHLLVGGLAGGALWGAVGGGLAGACLAVVCRRTWPGLARAAIALGLAGLGFTILLGALVAHFLFLRPDAVARPLSAVTVEAAYPGANAQVVADTVAAPIEAQVNGVEGMVAMRSRCDHDGSYTLTVTFEPGTDPAIARVLVVNRVSLAEPILPELVKRPGLTIKTASPGVLMVVNVFSPDGIRDALYLGSHAAQLRDTLTRLPGVGEVTFVGRRHDGVRVWLDRERLAAHDLTAGDVVRAIEQQNVRVAAGPAPEGPMALDAPGRPADAEELENIILKAAGGTPSASRTWPGWRSEAAHHRARCSSTASPRRPWSFTRCRRPARTS